jgi:hypothetical protein
MERRVRATHFARLAGLPVSRQIVDVLSPPTAPVPPSRLFADRRTGTDQRTEPRRTTVSSLSVERRARVDRRRGSERRSTLDRRGRARRDLAIESPAEHLRNALQLVVQLTEDPTLGDSQRADAAVVLQRVRQALAVLERRSSS